MTYVRTPAHPKGPESRLFWLTYMELTTLRPAIVIAIVLAIALGAALWGMGPSSGGEPRVAVANEPGPPAAPAAEAANPAPSAAAAAAAAAAVDAANAATQVAAPAARPAHGPIAGDPVDPAILDAAQASFDEASARWKGAATAAARNCLGPDALAGHEAGIPLVVQFERVAARHAGEGEALVAVDIRFSEGPPKSADAALWERCLGELRQVRTEIPKGGARPPEHASTVWMLAIPNRGAAGAAATGSASPQKEVQP